MLCVGCRCVEQVPDTNSTAFKIMVAMGLGAAVCMLLQLWAVMQVMGARTAAHRVKQFLDTGLVVIGALSPTPSRFPGPHLFCTSSC